MIQYSVNLHLTPEMHQMFVYHLCYCLKSLLLLLRKNQFFSSPKTSQQSVRKPYRPLLLFIFSLRITISKIRLSCTWIDTDMDKVLRVRHLPDTDRQQTNRQIERQKDRQIDKDRLTDRQKAKQTGRQIDRKTDRHINRLIIRQICRHYTLGSMTYAIYTDRQMKRQDIYRQRVRYRQTNRKACHEKKHIYLL